MELSNVLFRKSAVAAASVIVAVGAIAPACGGMEPDATVTRTAALTGALTIAGVVSETAGIPVNGVAVSLNGAAQASAVTDFEGRYSFSANPGSYSVSVSGVCGAFQPNVVNLNALTASNTQVNFVGSGGECTALTFSGGTSGTLTLSGHVTSAGHAVPGVKVTLAGSATGFRYTDQTGAYSFLVNPGSYSLQAAGGCAAFSPGVVNLNALNHSQVENFAGSGNCPPAPLALCPVLDEGVFGESLGAACDLVSSPDCAVDRVSTWANEIVFDFAVALSSDCRFGQWGGLLTPAQGADYLNDLIAFSLYFFGCPATGTVTGPLAFALIPSPLAGRTFTTADLAALSSLYSGAVAQALDDFSAPPLTAAQTAAMNAQLASLASKVPGTVNSPSYTFSTCP